MVISQNKYQIQIPHAIGTLERSWYYAMTIFISQVTFIRNPLPARMYIATVYMFGIYSQNTTSNNYRNQNVIADSDAPCNSILGTTLTFLNICILLVAEISHVSPYTSYGGDVRG